MGKKLNEAKPLYVMVEEAQHDKLRDLAHESHQSLGDVVRQALSEFLARQGAAKVGIVRPPGGDKGEPETAPASKGRKRQVPL